MFASLIQTAISWAPNCPIEALFGVACPGCGLTRALVLCAQGQVMSAMALNPMAPVLAVQAIGVVLARSMKDYHRVDRAMVMRRCLQVDLVALSTIWAIRLIAGL